jgi:hypothetical protein
MYECNWSAAEQDFQHAFRLNSNDAQAHHWYAEHLINIGQPERAVTELERRGNSIRYRSRLVERRDALTGMRADIKSHSISAGRRLNWILIMHWVIGAWAFPTWH